MGILKVVVQIGILTLMYMIGSAIQQYFELFVPGSVIGLLFMFILLTTGVLKVKYIKSGAEFMMKHLVIFFIPAIVGIINYYTLFTGKGSLLILTALLSTVLVMGISGWLSQKMDMYKRVRK